MAYVVVNDANVLTESVRSACVQQCRSSRQEVAAVKGAHGLRCKECRGMESASNGVAPKTEEELTVCTPTAEISRLHAPYAD